MASALSHEAARPSIWPPCSEASEVDEASMRFSTDLHALARAHSVCELLGAFQEAMVRHGFRWVSFALLTGHRALMRPSCADPLNTFPQEWVSHYRWRGYDQIDPIRREAQVRIAPFTWESLSKRGTLTRVQQRLLDEACEAGIRNGIGVPLHGPGGSTSVICLASATEGPRPTAMQLARVHSLSTQLYARYWTLQQSATLARTPATLSAKELQVLQGLATGLSQAEVAERLHVSTHGVDFHVRKILSKLEAKNITAAVYFATGRGLIDPG